MDEHKTGVLLGVGAYVVWGLSPIFWNLIDNVAPQQIMAHRVIWAIPILLLLLAARRTLHTLRSTYASKRTLLMTAAGGALLAANWGVFLWAVVSERILEISLGYFINPLVAVALGVFVLGERLRSAQRLAVGIAAAGVVGMTVMLGVVPWVSLVLAFSFGLYGLLKKLDAAAPPLQGLLGEVAIIAVPGVIYLTSLGGDGEFTRDPQTALWLVAAGLMTVGPLWMFGAGVQRIPLSTMGLLQYIAPTLQLVVGVAVFGEGLSGGEIFGFGLVWIALVVFARDQLTSMRRLASAPA